MRAGRACWFAASLFMTLAAVHPAPESPGWLVSLSEILATGSLFFALWNGGGDAG